MRGDERPLSSVPTWLWPLLAVALAAQLGWQASRPQAPRAAADLPPAPRSTALRVASVGEPEAAARIAMLYLQSFDLGGGNSLPYRNLDYARLIGWLEAIQTLDPRSDYPLFSAARLYAEIPDPARSRAMLEFVHQQFLLDPNRRWPALAHAALLAKHRLRDLPLARRYAVALERHTSARDIPLWAKQMEVFILEDMNELEAAKTLLGGLLAEGKIGDPAEVRFLQNRLQSLEQRLRDNSVK